LLTLVQEIVSLAPACEASWQFEERLKKLKEATQEMLKAEWERVKLGEKTTLELSGMHDFRRWACLSY
jgi:hypothetical protein